MADNNFKIGDFVTANDWPHDLTGITGKVVRVEGIYVWIEGHYKPYHISGVEKMDNVIEPAADPLPPSEPEPDATPAAVGAEAPVSADVLAAGIAEMRRY